MSVIENTKLAPELNYSTKESSYPVYHYRSVYPANGAERNFSIPVGASHPNTFDIPTEQVNIGDSYLEYTMTLQLPGANMFNWLFKDVFGEVFSVVYRDTGTNYLINERDLNLQRSVTVRLDTSHIDLEYQDSMNGISVSNAALSDVKSKRFDNTTNSLAYKEIQNMEVGGNNAKLVVKRKIYLRDLCGKHSYAGMKKDSLLPQQTYLEIDFTANRIGYIGTSPTDPRAGNALLTGNIAFTGLVLKLAVQMNEDLKKGMKLEIGREGGLTIPIPVTSVHLLTGTGANQAVFPVNLNRGTHGHKIQRLIYVPFYSNAPGANELYRTYDHSNDNGAVISQYHTELDNVKTQRDSLNISATSNDDYMYHKKLLKNTTYYNQNIYNKYWLHIDSLDYPETNHNVDGSIFTDGLTLIKPTIWSVVKLNGHGNAIYNMAIVQGQKLLRINETAFFVE